MQHPFIWPNCEADEVKYSCSFEPFSGTVAGWYDIWDSVSSISPDLNYLLVRPQVKLDRKGNRESKVIQA